eukprot:6099474-Prymnesium_polylepis.1
MAAPPRARCIRPPSPYGFKVRTPYGVRGDQNSDVYGNRILSWGQRLAGPKSDASRTKLKGRNNRRR